MSDVPDIVNISKLETYFRRRCTVHIRYRAGTTSNERRKRYEEIWQKERKLGGGSYGQVYLERRLGNDDGDDSNELRAVKVLSKKDNSQYYRELEALALFSHEKYDDWFVKSSGWYEDEHNIFVAMEYFSGGDLQQHMSEPMPEGETREIVFQLVQALDFMHQNGFAHRDLKPQNILVKCPGPSWWIKVADFGSSKRIANGNTALRTIAGTPAFIAPEILFPTKMMDDSYSKAVDIWSLGAIAFVLLTTVPPFRDVSGLARYGASTMAFPSVALIQQRVSESGRDLITSMMSPRPEDRPSTEVMLQSSWMQSTQSGLQKSSEQKYTPDEPTINTTEPNFPYHGTIDSDTNTTVASRAWTTISVSGDDKDSTESDIYAGVGEAATNEPLADIAFRPRSDTTNTIVSERPNISGSFPQGTKDASPQTAPSQISLDERLKAGTNAHEAGLLLFTTDMHAAEPYFQNAADIRSNVLGTRHEDTVDSLHWLGRTQYMLKKFNDAERSIQDTFNTRRDILGLKHEATADSLHSLGRTQYMLKKFNDAERSLQVTFDIRRDILGPNHEDTANSLQWLGQTQYELKKHNDAERSLQNTFDIRRDIFGLDHENTVNSLHWLGRTQHRLKKYNDAERLLQDVFDIRRDVLGLNHTATADSLHWLGRTQYMLKKFNDAERSLQDTFDIRRDILGLKHEDTADSLYCLGLSQYELKKYIDAERSFQEVFNIRRDILGSKHEATANSLYCLGLSQYELKKYIDAEGSYKEAFNISRDILGSKHAR